MREVWVTYRQADRMAKVSERTLRQWHAEGVVRWREGERGRVELALENVRRVKREKARKNVPLQRRAAKLQRHAPGGRVSRPSWSLRLHGIGRRIAVTLIRQMLVTP